MAQTKRSTTTDASDEEIRDEFKKLVNMQARSLEKWLDDDRSRSVGIRKSRATEAVGHQSGRKIVAILGTKKADLTAADYRHMHKVVGYIKRHLAQRPDGDVTETRWTYSLKNWGHDPTKKAKSR